MTVIKITKKKDSLELATKILENFFLKNENCSADPPEFEKWKKWFLHQSGQFRSGTVSNTLYLSKISRIRTFIIANTSVNADDLFEVEKLERKKSYDLTKLEKTIPQPLSEQEISKLTSTLFSYLTTDVNRQLKVNPRVESITKRMRDKRFGFTLDPDPYKNIRYIEDNNIYSDNINREKNLLGELFSESGQLEEAENSYLQISHENSKKAGLLKIAVQKREFDLFQSLLPQAYPESYKPETYGRYILTFLIGNEKSFKYEVDTSGKRSVSFAFSTGIIKIAHIDLFSTFLYDFRVAPDERIGLWLSPTNAGNSFLSEISSQLDYKQVLGWKDL